MVNVSIRNSLYICSAAYIFLYIFILHILYALFTDELTNDFCNFSDIYNNFRSSKIFYVAILYSVLLQKETHDVLGILIRMPSKGERLEFD